MTSIRMIPTAFAKKKLLTFFLSRNVDISSQNIDAQKGILRCSQTDSFTAEKEPTTGLLPEAANVKCSAAPRKIMNRVPITSKTSAFQFFINHYPVLNGLIF